MEKSFEEGRNMDLSMSLSVKELSSMANKEQIKFDSISLYVEVSFSPPFWCSYLHSALLDQIY